MRTLLGEIFKTCEESPCRYLKVFSLIFEFLDLVEARDYYKFMEKAENLMNEKTYCHSYDSLVRALAGRMEVDDEKWRSLER